MSKDLTSLLHETIFIPQSVWEVPTADLPISTRLLHVLQRFGSLKLGDLHEKSYREIYFVKDCGRGTIFELKNFIDKNSANNGFHELANFAETKKAAEIKKQTAETLYIPQEFRGLSLAAFPLPTRLANVLRDLDFRLVGDLNGFQVKKLKSLRSCGSHTVSDLLTFVEKIQQGKFEGKTSATEIALTLQKLNLAQFVEFIDIFLNEFSPRDRDILGLRFASEAAEILREDPRFTDLGRFHFALAEWEIEEREMVSDLIVKVLRQANRPLSAAEIIKNLENFRSVSPFGMSGTLSRHESVKDYGFGFYGLKKWKDERQEFLISNGEFVNRAVVRSEPPLTFGDLCLKLEIAETGFLADKLWRTLRALPKLCFKPNNQSAETTLIHTNWRFERAIQKVLAEAGRPLSAYEIQWELNRIFGATFAEKKLDSIKNRLENDELFVRNAQGEFLLNEQIDQDDASADLLRQACLVILKEGNAVLSTDDLLEKLEAEDLAGENVSAEMLAVLLRGDASFQEIGMNLFRATK